MAIARKSRRQVGQVKSQYNLQKLLLPTDIHPHGRVQLDPETNMPKTPKRNVLYMDTVVKNGVERKREVNGGHAKEEDSVWRIALAGPTRYIWKLLRDEMKFRVEGPDLRGRKKISAPTLTTEEMYEARLFVAYLLSEYAKNVNVIPDDFLASKYDHGLRPLFKDIDKKFYSWLIKQEKKPELPKLTDVYALLPV